MRTLPPVAALALLLGAASFAVVGCQSESGTHPAHAQETTVNAAAKPYPLNKCVVSGESVEHGQPYTFVYNGQEIKLCCKDCLADFNKDPQKYLAKINEAK